MTNNMNNNIKNLYAEILENQGHVGIDMEDGFSLDIGKNDDGYYLEVFEITNKDIRMSNANFLFMHFFNIHTKNIDFLKLNEKEQKKIIKACAEKVAHYLHNTVSVALNSYISKELIQKIKIKKVNSNLNVSAQIKKLIT